MKTLINCFSLIFCIHFTLGTVTTFAKPGLQKPKKVLPRISHARELLGKKYEKSSVKKSEDIKDVSAFVKATTRRLLPFAYKKKSKEIADTILSQAKTYELDPVFLMAMIQNESSFNPATKAPFGEIGLMQIKPEVGQWISEIYHLPYSGKNTLLDPVQNIKIGTAFLNKLREEFKSQKGSLYVAAYNMGPKNVKNLISEKKIPSIYLNAILKRYLAFYSALNQKGSAQNQGEFAWLSLLKIPKGHAVF